MKKNILILAGEPSGDMRAGELVKELRSLMPEAEFWGIGGGVMRDEGVDLVEHIRNLSVVGILEVIKHLPRVISQHKLVMDEVGKRKPDVAVLVDYPGFNLRIARCLKDQGVPVVYYIIPQVWAWGAGRVKLLRQVTDKRLVIFDFEKKFLAERGAEAEFVGHPLIDRVPEVPEKGLGNSAKGPGISSAVALLPGSRTSEISQHFETMLEASSKIMSSLPGTRFILAESGNVESGLYDSVLKNYPDIPVERVKDDTFSVLGNSDIGIVASGTATLESAVMGTPMVIVYRTNFLTYFLARKVFMTTPFLGLVNNIAGKEIAPELLQEDFTADRVSSEVLSIMNDPSRMAAMKSELKKVRDSLGGAGASRRAAESIKRFCEKSRQEKNA